MFFFYGQLLRWNVFLAVTRCMSCCCEKKKSIHLKCHYDNSYDSICLHLILLLGIIVPSSASKRKKNGAMNFNWIMQKRQKNIFPRSAARYTHSIIQPTSTLPRSPRYIQSKSSFHACTSLRLIDCTLRVTSQHPTSSAISDP